MDNGPPPDALVLALQGLRDARDHAAVEAAIRRCDPAARTWSDWSRGLVAIASVAPHAALRAAVEEAGFGAIPQKPPPGRIGCGGLLLRVFGGGLAGAAAGLALGVLLGLGNSFLNPNCTGSGNCAIGVGVFGGFGAFLGMPLGGLVGLFAGLVRLGRRPR